MLPALTEKLYEETDHIEASDNVMGSSAYRIASFDYAYNCVAAME